MQQVRYSQALQRLVRDDLYDTNWGEYAETGEETLPWLSWSPDHELLSAENPSQEVAFVNQLQAAGFLCEWSAFHKYPGGREAFSMSRYYGDVTAPIYEDTLRALCESLGIDPSQPDPTAALPALKALRDETRQMLGNLADQLHREVMQPLRNVFIPCAVEAARELTGFQPLGQISEEARERWLRTIRGLHVLWSKRIGAGYPAELVRNGYGRTFEFVPPPVADGAKAAIRMYVEPGDGDPRDTSRDDLLERARPVYLKWLAAQRLIGHALNDRAPTYDPDREADRVFREKIRPEGAGTRIPEDVREWAAKAHERFCQKEGLGPEKSKHRVLNIAESHGYHFSKRWLGSIIQP